MQRESLPIFKLRTELVQAIKESQVLVVVGDTGSGKTTQMTQVVWTDLVFVELIVCACVSVPICISVTVCGYFHVCVLISISCVCL